MQGPLKSVPLGLPVLQALGQVLLQGLLLARDLKGGRGESSRERDSGGRRGLLREKGFRRGDFMQNGLEAKWRRTVDVTHQTSDAHKSVFTVEGHLTMMEELLN